MASGSAKSNRKVGWLIGLLILAAIGGVAYKLSPAGRSGSELAKSMEKAKAAGLALTMEDVNRLYPPIDAADNSRAEYQAAFKLCESLRKTVDVIDFGQDPKTKKAYTPAQFDAAILKCKPIYDILESANRKPGLYWERRWSNGFAVLFPEYSKMKTFAKLLASRAQSRARNGNGPGAVHDIEQVFNLSSKLGREPVLIADLVRIACDSIGFASLGVVLNDVPLDEATLKAMQHLEASFREPISSPDIIRFETYMFDQSLKQVKSGADLAKMLSGSIDSENTQNFGVRFQGAALSMPGMITLVRAKIISNQAEIVHQFESTDKLIATEQKAKMQEFDRLRDQDQSLTGQVASALSPVFSQYREARSKALAMRNCYAAIVDAATLSHPARVRYLNTPLKTTLKHMDPFSGLSVLSVSDAQGLKVYSVGIDGNDDGGNLVYNYATSSKPTDIGILIGKRPEKK